MTNGDLQALDAAWRHLADVSALEGKDAAEREDIRVSALKAWLTLLAAIDAARDPEFDPDAPVDLGVEAPRQADGTALPGTPDPAQIKDPGQREAYQRALEQNRAQLGNSRFQTHVRRADERATSFAEEFITQYFAPQQSDQLLVSEIVEEAKLSADRRKRILSLLEISTR